MTLQPTPPSEDYDTRFTGFYHKGQDWARIAISTWLRPGNKLPDTRDLEQQAKAAFDRSGLGNHLSKVKTHALYRSDFEVAQSRFVSGAAALLTEAAKRRGLIKR